ncbi:unnamed protein product [Spirodela intermedia]|uniref:non-specific serine/threonine protein kinase n=1 Tax=Spirodela intermedia TaxID=51605 RepID=A0A7I8KN07_SPIIN|nr:unnamed protein product [Spirodela intermedia]
MKHIFKRFHFGGGHDPSRPSHEISASSVPSSSATSPTAWCGSNHRGRGGGAVGAPEIAPPSPSPSPSPSPEEGSARAAAERADYFSSEEEFQVQLALAISASNSEFREDRDNEQIREATRLSLGKQQTDSAGEEGTAELLSRRYWDYNVLDYDVKVMDGFCDIFGLCVDPVGHGKMPSLADLQTNIGDLGFEVIIVNRAIDPAIVELEQIAYCIALDCPSSEVNLLVQRISDLVSEHMGGPVRDGSDFLARWMERSSELRASLQTSLLAIGSIDIGLSRHRALLFKVLADHVGIPCKLVKGSHYTGVDDDAVNIIKLDNREFLVDLMAAPGTLIPADVLSAWGNSLEFGNQRTMNQASWTANDSMSPLLWIEPNHCDAGIGKSTSENSEIMGKMMKPKNSSSSSASSGEFSSSSFSRSGKKMLNEVLGGNPNQFGPSTSAVPQKVDIEIPLVSGQDIIDSGNLFAEFNPFQLTGSDRAPQCHKPTETCKDDFQRSRVNIVAGSGSPPPPMFWKNRSSCNEIYDTSLLPRKNVVKDLNTSSLSSLSSASPGVLNSDLKSTGSSFEVSSSRSACEDGKKESGLDQCYPVSVHHSVIDGEVVNTESLETKHESKADHRLVRQSNILCGPSDVKNSADKYFWRRCTNDRFMNSRFLLKDPGPSIIPQQTPIQNLDPVLDDVAEFEVPWEVLAIGERIGLGSYGEVYRADWNGKEVAVKKFLDQDFSGDALAEFRREVRIMQRLCHPNVIHFMGAVTRPPNLSIISEFLPRGSLYRILHRSDCKIDEKRRIKMALDVAKGMNCLHTSTPIIVHRDLKSSNLLVDKDWNVKVCDFGLSRLKHNTFLSSKSTAGTPEWMAPEVLCNEPSNEKCDVYSFGVILWELATLMMPWRGMNPMQVVGAVGFQNRRLDIPREVDPLVARIIRECWQTDPSLRPSFAQLMTALKPLHQLVISSRTDSPPPPQQL